MPRCQLFFAALLFVVAPAALHAAGPKSSPPFSILDKLVPNDGTASLKDSDGLIIISKTKKDLATLTTSAKFQPPFILTAVAKTDSNNIRLYFGDKGIVIFNWEVSGNELRFHDPNTGDQHGIADKGAVPKNTFMTIRWMMTDKDCRVAVGGIERAALHGDYAKLSGAIGVGTAQAATLTLKSLQIASPNAAASGLQILSAQWGAHDKYDDVTKKVQALIKDNSLEFIPSTAALGDSTPGSQAYLGIAYDLSGVQVSEGFTQGATVRIKPPPPLWPAPLANNPSMQEIIDAVDAQKYPDALAKLAKVIPLQGIGGAAYDHHQLLMLRAECLLQMRDKTGAIAAFTTARHEARELSDSLEAAGMIQLVQNSANFVYAGKADKKNHNVLDRDARKDAFTSLWADALPVLQNNVKSATTGSALPPIVRTAQSLPDACGVEFSATDNIDQCNSMIAQIRDKAAGIIENAVKDQNNRADAISQSANRMVHEVIVGEGEMTRKAGLTQGDVQNLRAIQAATSQIAATAQDLEKSLGVDQPFADLAGLAGQVNQKATRLLNTSF